MNMNRAVKFFLPVIFSVLTLYFLCIYQEAESPSLAVREEIAVAQVEKKISGNKKNVSPAPAAVPVQLQFLPSQDSYVNDHNRTVNGFALGYYLPQKEINGVSFALIHAYNEEKRGFSMSFLEYSGVSRGVSVCLAGGAQYNHGFAMGLWNMTESNRGLQLGLVNHEEKDLLFEYDLKPEVDRKKFGVQAGVINYSDAPGIQFGLWNTNPKSLIKHFPIFNICF